MGGKKSIFYFILYVPGEVDDVLDRFRIVHID